MPPVRTAFALEMRVFALCFLSILVACTETQVLVHFDADEELLGEASEVRVRVASTAETEGQVRSLPLDSALFEGFPITQPVSPFEGQSGRRFDVTGELIRSDGTVIARQRAEGHYIDGARSHVALRFSSACRGVLCGDSESCVRGSCVSACVIPTSERGVVPIRTECSPPTSDGGVADVVDAGGCPSGCGVLERCDGTVCVPETILSLSVGERTSCVLVESERAVCWGRNVCGELGPVPQTAPFSPAATPPHDMGIVASAIDCGFNHCCALSGTAVTCWGSNAAGQLARPQGSFESPVSNCGSPELPVRDYTETPVSVSTCPAQAISVAGDYACALCEGGGVECWGSNEVGQGGILGTPMLTSPTSVPGVADAIQLEAGPYHACARLENGPVMCWGFGASGQLGRGAAEFSGAPAMVDSIDEAEDLWLGLQHTCVLADALVSCFGAGETTLSGAEGEVLGAPLSRIDILSARVVSDLGGVSGLATGTGAHLCASANSRLLCWGAQGIRTDLTQSDDAPGHGELGRGDALGESADAVTPAPVSGDFILADMPGENAGTGRNHTCAVRNDGRVYCWGDDTYGQTSHGTTRRSPTLVRGYSR